MEVGQIYARIVGDISDFESKMSKAETRMSSVAANMEVKTQKFSNLQVKALRSIGVAVNDAAAPLENLGNTATASLAKTETALGKADVVSKKTGHSFGRLGQELTTMAGRALGTAPVVGQLTNVLGTMALGSVTMIGVMAAMTALGLAWQALTRRARENKEATKEAIAELEKLREEQRRGLHGRTPDDLEKARNRFDELSQQKKHAERGFAQLSPDARASIEIDHVATMKKLNAELATLQKQISAGQRKEDEDTAQQRLEQLQVFQRGVELGAAERDRLDQEAKKRTEEAADAERRRIAGLSKLVAAGVASNEQIQELVTLQERAAAQSRDVAFGAERQAAAFERAAEFAKALSDNIASVGPMPDFFKTDAFGRRSVATREDTLRGSGFGKDGLRQGLKGDIITEAGAGGGVREPSTPMIARLEQAGTKLLQGLGASLKGIGKTILQSFNPLNIISNILAGAFQRMAPALDALQPALEIVGTILAEAFAPILRGLFPIIKLVSVAFTYVAQFAFNLAGGFLVVLGTIQKGIGSFLYAIAKFVDSIIPFADPLKPLERAGQAMQRVGEGMIDLGKGFIDAASAMPGAREKIEAINLDDALGGAADAADRFADSMSNVPTGFKINLARFNATVPVDAMHAYVPRDLAASPPAPRFGGGASIDNRTTVEPGAIVIMQQPGEDSDALANRVIARIRDTKLRGGITDLDLYVGTTT